MVVFLCNYLQLQAQRFNKSQIDCNYIAFGYGKKHISLKMCSKKQQLRTSNIRNLGIKHIYVDLESETGLLVKMLETHHYNG